MRNPDRHQIEEKPNKNHSFTALVDPEGRSYRFFFRIRLELQKPCDRKQLQSALFQKLKTQIDHLISDKGF